LVKLGDTTNHVPLDEEKNMKSKIVMAVEFLIILGLLGALVTRYISLETVRPVVRKPAAPGESTLSYTPPPPPRMNLETIQKVRELKNEYSSRVDKITEEIYLARGYSLGSSIMVITKDGLVIIDTTGNEAAAKKILSEFRKISDKPIRYVIYTHGHLDHVYGTPVFISPNTEVIATKAAVEFMKRQDGWLQGHHQKSRRNQAGRAAREFGMKTPFKSPFPSQKDRRLIWPTVTFDESFSFELGGKRFELVHTTGETPGHLMVWMPGEKVLFPGDLYYASFPNLSTPMLEPRPAKDWYEWLDRMADLKPAYVVPSHTKALIGEKEVQDVLTHHAEAVRYVYNETLNAINAGKSVDEAVQSIKLPERLSNRWHLEELYGRVSWSIRGIYQKEIGWYDGKGTGLSPLPLEYRSRELIRLAGGADKILTRAIDLQKAGEHQLACELADIVIMANPNDKTARMIKAASLDYIGIQSGNLNMFGFYRSAASLERKAAGIKP
jgi:alkyl sulfatase BDS1-like metallo-beta-lactamase superfamily hydrolase